MMKWQAPVKGRPTFGIGLEIKDIEQLLKGNLIFLRAEDINLPYDVAIHYGSDLSVLMQHLVDAGITQDKQKPEANPVKEKKRKRNRG